jgi:3-oxoacyl-[acyl-carrier-protein] synthase III
MTRIRAIACTLPERELTNTDLARENPNWDMAQVEAKTGIYTRRVAAPGETAYDLSVRACASLIEQSELDLAAIDAIVYCTQTPDYVMPGNAQLLHNHLAMGDDVLAFDYSLGCSGYVYGLAFADAFVRGGLASEVLLVTADTLSRHIDPNDRTTRVLFGDGAAVTHLSAGDTGGGAIVATKLANQGQTLEDCYVPAGRARLPAGDVDGPPPNGDDGNGRLASSLHLNGFAVMSFLNATVPGHMRAFLAEQSLSLDDIDLCVFHQASGLALDSLAKALDLEPERLYLHMADVGNLTSSSIPFALRAALDDRSIRAGSRVLLSAYGVGASYGSALVEF